MSKKVKLISAILATTMVLSSFSACTSTSESSSDNKSSESSQTSVKDEAPNMDGDLQLNEPGEFPLLDGDPVNLSIFTQYQNDDNTKLDAADNTTTAWLEEKLNVDLDWTIVSAADKTAKLNLAFQSDNYEDIIFGTYWDGATQLAYGSQGYIIALNDYIENDSYYYQKYIDAKIATGDNSQTHWDSLTMTDGNIYSMATGNGGSHQDYNYRMWVFEPWLDTLNLEIPNTTEEFKDMLISMRDGDPNENGKADEIPLAGSVDGWNTDPFVFLANSFVYYPDNSYFFVDDGKIQMSYMQDEFKDAVSYYTDLVTENLMMTETFTQNTTTLKAMTTSELDDRIVGVTPGGAYAVFANFTNKEEGEWTKWVAIPPLEGPDGVRYAHQSPLYPSVKFNITNNCEHPRAAFRFLDALYKEEIGPTLYLGIEGIGWQYVEPETLEGEKGGYANFAKIELPLSETNYKWDSIATGVFPTWEWGIVGDPDLNQGVLLYRAANEYKAYAPSPEMISPPLIYDEESARDVVDIKTVTETYLKEAVVAFAMNNNVEEGWDAFIQRMKDLGVEELQALYQTAYEERMEAMG